MSNQTVYLSRAKYDAYRAQLEYMEGEGSAKLAELLALSPGSGMGRPLDLPIHDLAREFRAELAKINARVKSAVIIEDYVQALQDKKCVDIGATVTVRDLDYDDEFTYTIVGSDEVDPQQGRISYLSPLGQALLGKVAGERVRLNFNNAEFLIVNVDYRPLDFKYEPLDWKHRLDNMKV